MAIPITTQFDSRSNEEYFKLKIRRQRCQRCQRKNFYFKVTATDKLIRVHRRFSKLSGIPARSFVLTFNGRTIQPDDTPLTLGMRMEGDKRIKIEYRLLPTIGDFDLLGLSDIFPEEQLFGLSRVPWSKNCAHLGNRRKMKKWRSDFDSGNGLCPIKKIMKRLQIVQNRTCLFCTYAKTRKEIGIEKCG